MVVVDSEQVVNSLGRWVMNPAQQLQGISDLHCFSSVQLLENKLNSILLLGTLS